jgi:hypothetical protein
MENPSLVLDFVEWLAQRPRTYEEAMEAWRTSCPRLQIWEDALGHNLVSQERGPRGAVLVIVTADGRAFLTLHGRGSATTQ